MLTVCENECGRRLRGDWCFQGNWGCRLVVLSHSLIISVVVVWYAVTVVSAHSAQKRNWSLVKTNCGVVELLVTILRVARATCSFYPFTTR